jgi:hypothetical protein
VNQVAIPSRDVKNQFAKIFEKKSQKFHSLKFFHTKIFGCLPRIPSYAAERHQCLEIPEQLMT